MIQVGTRVKVTPGFYLSPIRYGEVEEIGDGPSYRLKGEKDFISHHHCKEACRVCGGHGADPMSDNTNWLSCSNCKGKGTV